MKIEKEEEKGEVEEEIFEWGCWMYCCVRWRGSIGLCVERGGLIVVDWGRCMCMIGGDEEGRGDSGWEEVIIGVVSENMEELLYGSLYSIVVWK